MDSFKTYLVLIFLLHVSLLPLQSQEGRDSLKIQIDSLTNLLDDVRDKKKIEILNDLAYLYTDIDTGYQSILEYASEALRLARDQKMDKEKTKALRSLSLAYYSTDKEKGIKYAEACLKAAKIGKFKNIESEILSILANLYLETASTDSAIIFARRGLSIAKEINDANRKIAAYDILGVAFVKTNPDTALYYWKKKLQLNDSLGRMESVARTLSDIGIVYKNKGDFQKAIESYLSALKILEDLNQTFDIARTNYNIGNVYYFFGDNISRALDYYQKAYENFEKLNFKIGMGYALNAIGLSYLKLEDNEKALSAFKKTLEFFEETGNKAMIAETENFLTQIYTEIGDYKQALKFGNDALEKTQELGNKQSTATNLHQVAIVYKEMGRITKALNYFQQSLDIAIEIDMNQLIIDNYKYISETYSQSQNYKKALEHFREYSNLKDSTFTEKQQKAIAEMEEKYKSELKEKEIARLNSENKLKQARIDQEQAKRRNSIIIGAIIIFFVVVVVIFVYRQYLIKKRANEELTLKNAQIMQQKEEIEAQRDEIERQRDIVVKQKQEITDSIQYASRIQRALLPPPETLDKALPDYFVLNKPRDIVSGDFYWMTEKDGKILIAAADCTGHGVPGAFMSMLGVSFLTEISAHQDAENADKILNMLRDYVMSSLRQTGKDQEAKDGMDIAMCIIDFKAMKMQYAGAYNPLYLIREKELNQVKADKMPIGIHFKGNVPFTNNEIDIKKGDIFYIFSDGYVDQFGGNKGRKFMAKRFKEILLENHEKPMNQQKDILNNTIEKWKGDHEQVDDMLVIGFKI